MRDDDQPTDASLADSLEERPSGAEAEGSFPVSNDRAPRAAMPDVTPTAPALTPHAWPPLAGSIGPEPRDFRVDEIPLYAPSGEGEHLYLHIQKECLNSEDVARAIAKAAGVSGRDVGYAGMKDRHAVTTQWFSVVSKDDPTTWTLPEGATLLAHARHGNKLRTGHLEANTFHIRLIDVDDGDALMERAQILQREGVLNGFDAQRFGRGGRNLSKAIHWAEGHMRRTQPFERKLFASVIQSEVFNRVLKARADADQLHVLSGDVMRLDGSRSVFPADDVPATQQRLIEGDVHLTGPMFGPKAPKPLHEAAAIEDACLAALQLSDDAIQRLGSNGAGTRRDLVVYLPDLTVTREDAHTYVCRFTLKSGSYATNVIRHLLRQPWSVSGDTRGAASEV